MEKGINLKIQEVKENLITEIENSNFPVTVIKYILEDILNQINLLERNAIKKEQEAYDKACEEENNKNTSEEEKAE